MNPTLATSFNFGSWTALDWVNHLWQSTAVGLVMLLLLALCGKLTTRTRLVLGWLALGKFALPAGVLVLAIKMIGGLVMGWFTSESVAISAGLPSAVPTVLAPASRAMSLVVATPVSASLLSTSALVWVVGFGLFFISWLVRGIWARRRLLRDATPVSDAVERYLAPAADLVGLKTIPRCVAVDAEQGPALVGVFSPVVILPRGLEDKLTADEFRAVLLHEFVHLQRRDNHLGALRAFYVAVLWFNPVAWLLNRHLRADSEKACDERVLELTGDAEAYVGGIVKAVHHTLGLPQPGLAGVTTPPVVGRIKNILDHDKRRADPWLNLLSVLSVMVGLYLVSLSGYAGTLVVAAEPAAPPEATLSVDFPDENIRDIIRSVADRFELNVIMPETLTGKTTVKLRDVTWRQIFQIVLTPTGHTFVEEDHIVRIVSPKTLSSITAPAPKPVATEDLTAISTQARLIEKAARLNREAEALHREVEAYKAAQAASPNEKPEGDNAAEAASFAALDARRQAAEVAAKATADTAWLAELERLRNAELKRQRALSAEDRAKQAMIAPEQLDAQLKAAPGATVWSQDLDPRLKAPAPSSAADQPKVGEISGSSADSRPADPGRAAYEQFRAGLEIYQPKKVYASLAAFEPGQLDHQPVPLFQARPNYPFAQRRANQSGEATVDFVVNDKGDVVAVYAIKFTQVEFAEAAAEAVAKWKFKPGRKDGAAVATHMQVPIVFSLNSN